MKSDCHQTPDVAKKAALVPFATQLARTSRVAKNLSDYHLYLSVSFEANVSEPWTKPGVATWMM